MLRKALLMVFGWWLALSAMAAEPEPRVALVIGNAAYADGALRNPVNDAREMARTLRGLGFTVLAHENLGKQAMEQAVLDYGRRIAGGGVGLVYYAGHGLQVRGRNYLVPVDARISDEAGTRVAAVDVDLLLEQMSVARNRVNVLILDACRNNPFERRLRGTSTGLAPVDAARGTLVAYATAPGSVAADGQGQHGLYTDELLKALRVPGLKIEEVFKRVRAGVADRSKGAQTPWESSSLTGDLVINVTVQVAAPSPAPAATADRDALFWSSIKDSKDPAGYRAYLKQFPDGTFAELARQRAGGEGRFDGAWAVKVVCADLPGVQGYTLQIPAQVTDSQLLAQLGSPGQPGTLTISGRINADGSASFQARGHTGESKFSVGHIPQGSPYGYPVVAQFDDQQGSGRRADRRPCDLTFTRR